MNMEKNRLLLVAWLSLLVVVSALLVPAARAADSQYVQVENVKVSPASILPGDTFTISFDVRNLLNDDLKYMYVTFSPDANFKVVGSDTWAYQDVIPKKEAVTASFKLKVSRDAIADVYSVPFSITSESKIITAATGVGSIYTTSVSISQTAYASVEVSGRANLVPSLSGSQPGMIEAGGAEALVTVKVFNNGSDTAKDVWIMPMETEYLKIGSASRSLFLGEIAPGTFATVPASVSLEIPTGASGEYTLPMDLIFADKRGRYEETHNMEIKVADRARFSVLPDRISLVPGTNDQRIAVSLQNTGNVAAEDVELALVAEYPLTASGRTSFIQRVEPGKSGVAYFTLDVDSKAAEQGYSAELLIRWREGETALSSSRRVSIEVAKKPALASNAYLVIAVLAAVILGVVLYKRHFGKKKKATAANKKRR